MREFNATERAFDSEATVGSLLRATFARTPEAVALVTPDVTLTFAQLGERAARLASHLAALGARPESVVGVCLERSAECVVSLLAIHLSGAACLPLEPSHPPARRASLLRQSGAVLVVSRPALFEGAEVGVPLVQPEAADAPGAAMAPPLAARAESLAYLLYTSGSTGEPKGVELTQRNVVHCFAAFDDFYATRPGHTWAASGSLSFDIHLEELLFSLTRGARVVLRPVGPLGLGRDIARHGISHIVITPSSLAAAFEEPGAPEALRKLSVLVAGGEVLPDSLVQQLAFTSTRLVNTYGPTETSINVAAELTLASRPVRLGKPLDRCQLYVLDDSLQPLPVGVPGEVFIGGTCLGRGYRGRADLTAERFIPDAFSGVPGARLYRTGDRARWNEDGSLSFLGRTDFQLKVRGVRVELEEIEAALLRVSGVRQAAVVARRGLRDTELVAYLVLDGATQTRSVRDSLATVLPEALVPSRLIALDSLPTNTHGKVDRQALAAIPVEDSSSEESVHSPPRGPVEELLAQLFCQVLGLEKVSRDADFFALGGHSLSATRLVARVRQAFGVELPLAALFASPTVLGLARALTEHQQTRAPALPAPMPRPPGTAAVPSLSQERMWFLQQLQPDSAAYLIPEALELSGALDVAALESSLRLLLERHVSLRSYFPPSEGRPLLAFHEVPRRVLVVEDLLAMAEDEDALQSMLSRRLLAETSRPFSLERGPLYRFHLFRLAAGHHVLLLVLHHLVVDGLGMDVLLRELAQAYASFREQRTPTLPAPLVDYVDVAAWQRTEPVREREDIHVGYWKERLAGAPALLALPTDRPRPSVLSDRGAFSRRLRVPPALWQALNALCRRHQVTPFMALYAAFAGLLQRYSGQDELCVGTPVAGRSHPVTDDVVGLFINTLVLRTRVDPRAPFSALLAQVRATALEAFAHQEAPFERVVEALHVERSLSHAPLFQVMFDLNRVETSLATALPGLTVRSRFVDNGTSQLDLALTASEDSEGLELFFQYRTDLFDRATVERMLVHYVRFLEHALEAPDQSTGALSLLSPEEHRRVVREFNATERTFDSEATVGSLLRATFARTPEAVALVTPDVTLTFAQLGERAARLASHLAALGARPESVVGVCLERSAECVVSLLAIHLSGAACLPLEPSHPPARRASLLRQSGAVLVVSRPALFEGAEVGVPLVQPEAADAPGAAMAPPLAARAESLAYLLYTSGSTGEPKGVELTQRNVVHCFAAFDDFYATRPGHTWAASGSLSFDIHLEELLFSLTRGARVILRPVGPLGLGRDIARHGISHIVITPSSLAAAFEEPGAPEALRKLSVLVAGGEVLPDSLVQQLAFTSTRLVNTYGPTETSINVAAELTLASRPVRLGKPLDRCQLYVLDDSLQPLPVGVPGEVFIGGTCLGRGYRGRADLTAERFIPDAFSGVPGARLYRTGDRARWNEDGSLSFLGRTDFQLKVRGVRVELEEIEAALLRVSGVRQAAVVARRGLRDTELLAYLVLDGAAQTRSVRDSLATVLPEALVPSRLIALDSLPTNTHGKVDRQALAAIPVEDSAEESVYSPPRGPVEELLAQLFCQVLGLEKVSRDADFFALGGHSLSATRLVARVRQAFGVELPLAALFASPSVLGLARVLDEHRHASAPPLPAPTPRPEGAPSVASFAQERLWFLHQLQPGLRAYHVPEAVELRGDLDVSVLESSLRLLLERHPVLRTTLVAHEGRPVPRLNPLPGRVLHVEELSASGNSVPWPRLLEESTRPFSLEQGPLYRFHLFRLAPGHHVLLLVLHHVLVDGLSMDVLLRELASIYTALTAHRAPALPPVPLDYADVAAWQRTASVRAREEAHLAYWKRQLAGAPALLSLPTDKPRPAVLCDRGALSHFHRLSPELTRALASLCRQHQVTPFMALGSAFMALMRRYSGQDDLCVGTPVSGRIHPATEEVVGLFTNNVVLRTHVPTDLSFASLLARMRATSVEAFAHQEAPFERVVDALQVERSLSHSPLFQVAFIWEHAESSLAEVFPGLDARPLLVDSQSTQVELALNVFEDAEGYALLIQYSTDLFEAPTIERFLAHYVRLLEHALEAPDLTVGALSLLAPEERQRVVRDFNAAVRDSDAGASWLSLFEGVVDRDPDAPALDFEGTCVTYRQLDTRANQLAWHLRSLGVGPETRVALCVERSPDLVIGMLGVLKAGGAFVPLDASQPSERLGFMLADSAAPVLITQESLADELPSRGELLVLLDADAPLLERQSVDAPDARVTADSLAYVIYTSGTTGRPKGALLHHGGLRNTAVAAARALRLRPEDRVLQFASPGFDASVWEVFSTLSAGATLVLAPRERLLPDAPLRTLLREQHVTAATLTPSVLAQLETEGLDSLATVVSAGEALPLDVARRWASGRVLLNAYGPTEVTVCAAITPAALASDVRTITLGRPWPGTCLYVLDEALQPLPIGVPGELFIGGAGVARGYLNRPDLTSERFVPDAFSGVAGARLYRTGDKARWLESGELEYLGRLDSQVKVRGVRIELGEIEAVLARHPEVREAAVVLRSLGDAEPQLVAYVVPSSAPRPELRPGDGAQASALLSSLDGAPSSSALRAWLRERLPDALVPSAVLSLSALPLTSSGKLDRKALSALPVEEAHAEAGSGEAPRGPVEELLAQLFCNVLGVESVTRDGHFFELGGHSLSATRLVARVRQSFGVELPLATVFATPTVAGLARALAELQRSSAASLPAPTRLPPGETAAPSFAQERLWFLHQLQPGLRAYHIPEAVELHGALDVTALESSLHLLLERHPVLRSVFPDSDGRPRLAVSDLPSRALHVEDVSGQASLSARLREEATRPFSLEEGPLYRFRVFRLAPEHHVLQLVLHHIVVDGLSMEVLLRDMTLAYAAFHSQQAPALPSPALDYPDVAAWQRTSAVRAREEAHLDYWKQQLAGAPSLLALPTDRTRPPVLTDKGAFSRHHSLPAPLAQALGELCRRHQVTPFMALYAAFAALLHRYSGQDELCVGTPVAGRTHPATEELVGLFINTLVLRTQVDPRAPFSTLLASARATALDAFAHQEAPFERIVEALQVERSLSHTPLFQVMFDLNRGARSLGDAFPELRSSPVHMDLEASPFDLVLTALEDSQGYTFYMQYHSELFEPESIERLMQHYVRLLEGALRSPETPVGRLPLLGDAEREQVLSGFNASSMPLDAEATWTSLFDAQVARSPDAPALCSEDSTLTYRQLDTRANQLAWRLRSLGVGPESRAVVAVERSPELVIGMLAVLKAGGAFVPFDVAHPAERLGFLLADSAASVVITRGRLAGVTRQCVDLEAEAALLARMPTTTPPSNISAESLAYVIYTSGTTGTPKGSLLHHHGLCNTSLATVKTHGLTPGRRVLQNASPSFDALIWEVFAPLVVGATVVVAPRERLLPDLPLRTLLHEQRIQVITLTPSVLAQLETDGLETLETVVSGGEALPPEVARRWGAGRTLLNAYGPTEVTVCASITAGPVDPERLTLGRAWPNTRLYVLDEAMQPLPVGVPGELFVGGAGVARGYLGRPDLTAERFVPDTFSGVAGARLYRTGDRVRWLKSGELEYLGRLDSQVKVRGVRIELGEIEAVLAQHPEVREVAVAVRAHGAGDKRLVAFLVPTVPLSSTETGATTQGLDTAAVRAWARERMPEHHVPSTFVLLPSLPLTPSGKLDRKALARVPLAPAHAEVQQGEPPRTPTETLLAKLFCQVLGLESVSRNGHFFELGGHSLSATRLVARVRQTFGVELPLAALFTSPTVAELAERIDAAPRAEAVGPTAGPRPELLPASVVQERLWYALQLPDAPPYVLTTGLVLEGTLDIARLEAALAAVVERNETLRTTFFVKGDAVLVRVQPLASPVLTHVDLSHLPPAEAVAAARAALDRHDQTHFDLQRGPLYRFELARLDSAGTRHALLLAVSHIVIDGLGLQAFAEELAAAWRAASEGRSSLLPPLAVQYTDFALWQRRPEHLRRLDASLESWKQALSNAPPVLDLPLDFPRRAPALNANMRAVRVSLRTEDTNALRELARREGVSVFTALLALESAWLHRLSGQSHVVVASPFSGRTTPQVERLVGDFANVLPLCTDVSGNPSFRELLRRARSVVAHATAHQEVPFKRIADAVQPDGLRTAPPLAQALLLAEEPGIPSLEGLTVSELGSDGVIPAYDVVVSLSELPGGGLEGLVAADSALFTPETGVRLARAFEQLALSAVRAPDAPLSRLSLLSSAQRAQVLAALEGPPQPVPAGACIHTLFEAQVRRTPSAPAVAHDDSTWSYAELNARANLLASQLVAQGLRPEERVGVVMEPSNQAMAVLLGILKAGGTYVPLDAGWPEPRKRAVLERARVQRIWADADVLEGQQGLVPHVEVPPQPDTVPHDLSPGPREVPDSQLAYIVFTSGSTGEPKGVMVEHRSVVNHNLAIAVRFGLRPGDRMLQFAPLTFDAAAEDLYPPLAVGATVVMRSGLVPAHAMTPYLEETGITIISLPPTYIEEWIRQMETLGQRVPSRLKLLAPGGDVLKKETYEAWVRVGGGHAPWVNVYGPTECTITSATCDIPGAEGVGTVPTFPIGRPMPRVRFYLLDEHLEPVLPGLPGRVYIGGVALSRGYLEAPHLTSERFLPDPLAGQPGARMYHTGDLARLQPDGRLRFLGRADHQVKIRGFRIELSEIEGCLRRYPGVEEAVVVARTSSAGTQSLCAYVQAPAGVRADSLREHVAAQLPGYMVPAAFVVMEQLPINANGKVDRQALPDPDALVVAEAPRPTAPSEETRLETPFRSTLEMALQGLWTEILGRPQVRAEDDFFTLGGDSILAMRLLARLEELFGVPLPLAVLFQNPTLKESADAIREFLEEEGPRSSVVRLSGSGVPENAPPLFLFHPGDGELHHYRDLVPRLESRFRCYGIQAPETLSRQGYATFDARVAAYAKDIRAVQPHGPYRLAGFSYGGYPALGVASLLEAEGEEVELLALVDTLTSEAIRANAPEADADPVLALASEFGVRDAALERELASLDRTKQWELLAQRAKERGTAAAHFQGRDFARIWHVLGEVLAPQARDWKVPPAPRARVRVISTAAVRGLVSDELLGWGQHLPRECIDVVTMSGEHATVLHPPLVDTLAGHLLPTK
ncbi:amino acid adenylation domain-containing protein [Pyxidicoccus parkwayensis]|uniref:Amino acid adenylation domain-containing protein n=1 Tax=Pyxidicoccus parkwayensis TaxID=2813578 RepID=A0ABX7NTT6_9BACT|nr:amino acid adenylation domain-containing protein [Pyxidicoccus parkwaysis]